MNHIIEFSEFRRLVSIVIAVSAMQFSTFAQSGWEWRNRLPQGNGSNCITFADGMFVAAGNVGTILTSNDGISWSHHHLPTAANLGDVAYGNGTWVAVGEAGTVFTSSDGETWREQPRQGGDDIASVCFGNGKFIMSYGPGVIRASVDGIAWQTLQEGVPPLLAMAYNGAVFVGVGSDGAIFTSPDGVIWTKRNSGTDKQFLSVVYNGAEFIAAGGGGIIRSSPDGIVWSAYRDGERSGEILHAAWTGVGSDAQRTVIVGWSGYSVVYNADGSTLFPKKLVNTEFSCVAAGNGVMVAGGTAGELLLLRDSVWTDATQAGPTVHLSGMAWGNGCFVGVSEYDHIVRSTTGDIWSDTALWDVRLLSSITFGNNRFVAVEDEKILSSADGLVWKTDATMPMLSHQSISYGNGRFVILSYDGSSGYELLSSGGDNVWTKSSYTTNKSFYEVSFCNDRFLICGTEGVVRSSVNGVSWTTVQTGSSEQLYDAAWGKGLYVTVGSHATILTSTDAAAWQDRSFPGEWRDLYVVRWCGDRFVAGGYYGILATSSDGIAWSLDGGITNNNLNAIAFNEKRIIVAGNRGTIISLDRDYTMPVVPGSYRAGVVPRLSRRGVATEMFDLAGRVHRQLAAHPASRLSVVKNNDGTVLMRTGF